MLEFISYFTEKCGAEWRIYQDENNESFPFWVEKSNNIASDSKPFIHGFYCDNFGTINKLLNN